MYINLMTTRHSLYDQMTKFKVGLEINERNKKKKPAHDAHGFVRSMLMHLCAYEMNIHIKTYYIV